MEQTAKKFEQVNHNLQTMLSRLLSELEVLRTGWQGRGGRSFEQVKESWVGDQKSIQKALEETAGAIRTSGQQFTASDEAAAGRFTGSGPVEISL
jgi:WXG100 family type VII secretion target